MVHAKPEPQYLFELLASHRSAGIHVKAVFIAIFKICSVRLTDDHSLWAPGWSSPYHPPASIQQRTKKTTLRYQSTPTTNVSGSSPY